METAVRFKHNDDFDFLSNNRDAPPDFHQFVLAAGIIG
jgi:hypothetical protein